MCSNVYYAKAVDAPTYTNVLYTDRQTDRHSSMLVTAIDKVAHFGALLGGVEWL